MSTYKISDIVDVIVSISDRPITRAGFTTPLILIDHDGSDLTDRVSTFTAASDLLDAGFLSTDDVYIIASKIMAGQAAPREFKVGWYDTTATPTAETVTDGIAACAEYDSNFFWIVCDSHVKADIEAIALWAEANKRIYITSSQDADIITNATTDVATALKSAQYHNTLIIADDDADANFPEAGVVGSIASIVPGSTTLHGKTLPGVSVTSFTRTQANFATGKNANIYSLIGGVGFFKDGKMASGRFLDVTWGSLYLEARMEEDIFGVISRASNANRKIPYTDAGLVIIEATMYARLQRAVAEGFLAESPAPKVIMPLVSEIPVNDRAERFLPDIPFEGTLAGAVHNTVIRGYLQV